MPFPIAVGNTWKYTDTDGATVGTTVNTIAAVTPVSGGQQVKMDGTISNLGLTSHSSAYFIFHSDGSITYPFRPVQHEQFNDEGDATVRHHHVSVGRRRWPLGRCRMAR